MSKIQSYDKNIYPCIRDAVYEIMDRHLLVAGDVSIYDAAALNDVLFFLCKFTWNSNSKMINFYFTS